MSFLYINFDINDRDLQFLCDFAGRIYIPILNPAEKSQTLMLMKRMIEIIIGFHVG